MIHQFSQDARANRLMRWNLLAIAASIFLGLLVIPSLVQAKTIFDDDWVPPKSDTPVQPPAQPPPATQPVTPPESGKPDTSVTPPSPPTVAVPVHRPIPAKADQAKSRKLFKEFYAADLANHSAAGRRALATKLLEQAGAVSDAPSDQFVLLVGATEAAKEASDLALVSRAADALAEAYDVDGLHVKSDAATQMALRVDSPATTTENCRNGLELVDQLASAGDFITAIRLLKSLQSAAPDAELRSQIQSKTKEVDAQKTAADRIAMFSQKLKTAPDDPVANLAVGQCLCFVKGDWAHGLPLIAKGSDAAAKSLAAQELKNPADAEGQLAVADGWWTFGDAQHDPEKTTIQSHARDYYGRALPALTGLAKLKAETRLSHDTTTLASKAAPKKPLPGPSRRVLPPATFLSDLQEEDVRGIGHGQFGKKGDLGYPPGKIIVANVYSPHGLSLCPPSNGWCHVAYNLAGRYSVFMGTAAILNGVRSNSPVVFRILGDGKELWRSRPTQGGMPTVPLKKAGTHSEMVGGQGIGRETETVPLTKLHAGLVAELFQSTDFKTSIKKRIDRQIYFDWQKLGPDPAMDGEKFSIRWTGLLRVPKTGTYTLFASVDNEAEIWIDGTSVLSQHEVADSAKAEAPLTAGLHPIRIDYRNTGGEGHLLLQWEQENGFERQCLGRDVLCHDPATAADVEPAQPGWRSELIYTGRGGTPFCEAAPPNTVLVGFELTKWKPRAFVVIKSVRAIYRGPTGEVMGAQIGEPEGDVVRLVAKPGFAVGMIHATYGLRIDRLSLHFMRLHGDTLDPSDSYDSPDFGGGGGKVTDAGEGKPVIGIYGVANQDECCSLGVITKE